MLDDLLGRTELKERIAALEDERDSLQARMEAEGERRRDAVRARQEAEECVNRLEDRIADLEGRLDRTDDAVDLEFRHRETISGRRAERVVARLESFAGDPESVCTAFLDGDVPAELEELLGSRTALLRRAMPCLVVVDDAGLLATALRAPVPPEPFLEWNDAPTIERAWFLPTGRFALALVRSDTFAFGVYEGDERVEFEGFESDVKSDHSKGGFSQARFERLRDEQIADHVERCEAALADAPDPLYVVGDRRLIREFDGRAAKTAAVDATGAPEHALEDAFDDFWTGRLYGL